MQGPAHLLLQ